MDISLVAKMKKYDELFLVITKEMRKNYIKENHYYFIHYLIMMQKAVI